MTSQGSIQGDRKGFDACVEMLISEERGSDQYGVVGGDLNTIRGGVPSGAKYVMMAIDWELVIPLGPLSSLPDMLLSLQQVLH